METLQIILKKIDISLLVQKPYLKTNYIGSNFEKDKDSKGQYRNKKLPDPFSIRVACSKNYVDNKFKDPNIIKNTNHVDFNDKNLDTVNFIKLDSIPTLEQYLTPKFHVDRAIPNNVDASSFFRIKF